MNITYPRNINNGTVLIDELTGPKLLRRFMNWWFTKWPTGDHAVYSRAEMEEMLRKAGFDHICSRLITPFTYVCVGRKTGACTERDFRSIVRNHGIDSVNGGKICQKKHHSFKRR